MRPPVLRLHADEIIVDNFAGGGGASLGIEWALGRSPDIAINHDPQAVAMHAANHPKTRHYVEDVWKVDPVKACGGRPVGLAWFSPDCKHFSKAKGGKPVSKKIRGLAWIVVKWAKLVKPRVICLENVEEFQDWGPLGEDDRPDKLRKGLTFQRWKAQLENLGYKVEWRELVAADYGAPTTRKRLFLVARCDGQPIRWPQPTHCPQGRGLPKWRAAAECIDWTLPCPSIFLTAEEAKPLGIKRPLAENTMRRIARGLKKFVLDNPRPFIVPYYGIKGDENRARDVDDPLPTQSTENRFGLIQPYMVRTAHGETGPNSRRWGKGEHPLDEPLPTQPASKDFALAVPFVAKFRGDSPGTSVEDPLHTITAGPAENPAGAAHAMAVVSAGIVPLTHQGADRNESIEEPMRTVTGAHRGEKAVAAAYVTRIGQTGGNGDYVRDAEAPLSTITSKNEHLVTTAYLAGVGGRKGQSPETGVEQPYHTITAKADTVLVAPYMVPRYGEDPDPTRNNGQGQAPRALPVDKPMPTIVPTQNHASLVTAFLARHFGGTYNGAGTDMDAPVATITPRDHNALVAANLTHFYTSNTNGGQGDLFQPMKAITAEGQHHAVSQAFLLKYYKTQQDPRLEEPLHTITATDRFGLVVIEGALYEITDIGMRMLVPPELYRAQGFPSTYKIDVIYNGKPLPKDAQVRMCGNSVSPYPCAALVQAQFIDAEEAVAA